MPGNLTKRPSEFTEEEKQELANLFVAKLKASGGTNEASVYTNRVPFNLDDLTVR